MAQLLKGLTVVVERWLIPELGLHQSEFEAVVGCSNGIRFKRSKAATGHAQSYVARRSEEQAALSFLGVLDAVYVRL